MKYRVMLYLATLWNVIHFFMFLAHVQPIVPSPYWSFISLIFATFPFGVALYCHVNKEVLNHFSFRVLTVAVMSGVLMMSLLILGFILGIEFS